MSRCSSAPRSAACCRSGGCARAARCWAPRPASSRSLAFCVLATAGLSILTRYLLLPATILAIFAAAAICGWTLLPREDPWRLRWAALGLITALGCVAFIPSQVDRLRNTRSALVDADPHPRRAARRSSTTTRSPTAVPIRCPTAARCRRSRCGPTVRPRAIRSAQETGRWTDPSIVPDLAEGRRAVRPRCARQGPGAAAVSAGHRRLRRGAALLAHRRRVREVRATGP